MAKKKAKPKAAKTQSQRILDEQREKLYASAVAKNFQKLQRVERIAVETTHWQIFLEQYQNIPRLKFSELVGCGKNEPRDFQRSRGFPFYEAGEQVNGYIVFSWLWEYFARGPKEKKQEDLTAEASKEMKDELVKQQVEAVALKNRREKLRQIHMEQEHLPTSRVREEFGALASMIAKRREDLERKIKDKAVLRIVRQAFEDMADDAMKRGEALGDG